jgi:hypothetical protein
LFKKLLFFFLSCDPAGAYAGICFGGVSEKSFEARAKLLGLKRCLGGKKVIFDLFSEDLSQMIPLFPLS